jgi:hypothetical protein
MKRKALSGILLLFFLNSIASKTIGEHQTPNPYADSSRIERIIKRNLVELAPNPSTDGNITLTCTALSEELHFYVFDLEGTLMRQLTLKGNGKYAINHLQKGVYTYDVFKNDESVEQGKITVN